MDNSGAIAVMIAVGIPVGTTIGWIAGIGFILFIAVAQYYSSDESSI